MPVSYVAGDATQPRSRPAILVHVVNTKGAWGAGFVLAVSRRWPEPAREYRAWHRRGAPSFALGRVQFVDVGLHTCVANMVAQEGFGSDGLPPIRYDALENCLGIVGDEARAREASVHMPRIACGIAGGTWDRVEPILERTLSGIDVVVYDLPARGGT